jgi:hypothetical protein
MRSVLFFSLPLFVVRLYSLAVTLSSLPSVKAVSVVARGFASDLAVGTIAGLLLCPLMRKRMTYFSLWTIWVLLHALNVEHITVNAANTDLAFFRLGLTREFIMGSVVSLKSLGTFLLCFALSAVSAYGVARLSTSVLQRKFWMPISLILALLILFIPVSVVSPSWVQMNFLEQNAKSLLKKPDPFTARTEIEKPVLDAFFGRDLEGIPVLAYPGKKQNVLLILVEGISYDIVKPGIMDNFSSLYDGNIRYTNFISLQRHTNNGVYAVVCGDYPNFLSKEAKSDIASFFGTRKKCLPEILKQGGYHTVFLQSAPLGFMQKDRFLDKAGFHEVLGYKHFPKKAIIASNPWGVDDQTLYNQALKKIRELEGGNKPWFLTLLTVSTHHPYVVPGKASPSGEEAIAYADSALGYFMNTLRALGIYKNTLIVVTSDEATFGAGEGIHRELSKNHAPLIVMAPQMSDELSEKLVHEDVFTQADLALSLADYLGLDPLDAFGRSIFRRYETTRNVLFGNVFSTRAFSYSADNTLYVCSYSLNCSAFRTQTSSLFSSALEAAEPNPEYMRQLTQALAHNELDSRRLNTSYVFYEKNRDYTGFRILIGDHKLFLDKDDTATWDITIHAQDPIKISVAAYLVQKVGEGGQISPRNLFEQVIEVPAGKNFTFHRDFRAPLDGTWIWTKTFVNTSRNGHYSVKEIAIKRKRSTDIL